jgi:hypothetical protein
MASAVVLPGSQRRLRHVEALCFRNLSMPDQERVTRARGMTLTTRMRRGTVTHRAQTEAKAETALLPSTRFHLYSPNGEVFYTSEVCASSLHPTFAPLPQDVRSFTSPKLRIVLENVDTGKAIMDVEVDVRRLTFESRTLANARSGNTTGLVMFKCEDGIFKIGGRSRHGPATTENGAAAAEGAQGGGGNSDDEDTWDLVDADCVLREDERKSKGGRLSSTDVLAMTSATVTLADSATTLGEDISTCRAAISQHYAAYENTATSVAATSTDIVAQRTWEHQILRVASRRQQLEDSNAQKRLEIATRRAALESDVSTLDTVRSASPDGAQHEMRLSHRRVELASQLRAFVNAKNTDATVLGFTLTDDPSTEDDNVAYGYATAVFKALCAIFDHTPLNSVQACGSRPWISEGPSDSALPLHVVAKSDKLPFSHGLRLFRANIVVASHAINSQHQAEGLPIALAFRKLLCNS